MINLQEHFEIIIDDVLKRVSVMEFEQMVMYLKKRIANLSTSQAQQIIREAAHHGILYISMNHYILSKRVIPLIFPDNAHEVINFNNTARIRSDVEIPKEYRDIKDCLWLALDMMPGSKNFFSCHLPYLLQFTMPKSETRPPRLVQIAKFPREEEAIITAMIESQPTFDRPEMRLQVQRIALLDDPDYAYFVPKRGFTHICVLDESRKSRFRVISVREERDTWD